MSIAPALQTVGLPIDEISVTKVIEPTKKEATSLPAKYFKNQAFGYWLLLKFQSDGVIDDTTFNTLMKDHLKVYSSISDQTSYYESFDDDFKMVSKDLKKLMKDFHKPPKVIKPKNLKKLKEKTEKTDTIEPKKRGRPKKEISKQGNDDDLISSIVSAALSNPENKPRRVYVRKNTKKNPTTNDNTEEEVKKEDAGECNCF